MVAYRTYPHVDMADTGARAARLLERMLRTGQRLIGDFHTLDYLTGILVAVLVHRALQEYLCGTGKARGDERLHAVVHARLPDGGLRGMRHVGVRLWP